LVVVVVEVDLEAAFLNMERRPRLAGLVPLATILVFLVHFRLSPVCEVEQEVFCHADLGLGLSR
jgi:hypothetical protein